MTYAHTNGLQNEGPLLSDNLFDLFTVTRKGAIRAGSGVLARGTALGKITATGDWVISIASATDGSAVIAGILLHDVDAGGKVEAIIGICGTVNPRALIFGAGHDAATKRISRGIAFETVIGG